MEGVPKSKVDTDWGPTSWAVVGTMFSSPRLMVKLTLVPLSANAAAPVINEFSGVGTTGARVARKLLCATEPTTAPKKMMSDLIDFIHKPLAGIDEEMRCIVGVSFLMAIRLPSFVLGSTYVMSRAVPMGCNPTATGGGCLITSALAFRLNAALNEHSLLRVERLVRSF